MKNLIVVLSVLCSVGCASTPDKPERFRVRADSDAPVNQVAYHACLEKHARYSQRFYSCMYVKGYEVVPYEEE